MGFYDRFKDEHFDNVLRQLDLEKNYRILWSQMATHVWVYERETLGDWQELALIDMEQFEDFLKEVRMRGFYVKERITSFNTKTYLIV